MSEFQRNTAYLYLYENGQPIRNIGFIKRTRRSENDRLLIHIKGYCATETEQGTVYVIQEQGDHNTAMEVGTITIDNRDGEYRLTLQQEAEGHIGIAVLIQEQECIGWYDGSMNHPNISYPSLRRKAEPAEELRPAEALSEERGEPEKRTAPEENAALEEAALEEGASDERDEKQNLSTWERLERIFPIVYPFEYAVETEYLSITPNEIKRFDASEYVLMNNSFLQHAYYNYKYLVLGRRKQKREGQTEEIVYHIGVPGIYHEREIMMANMFGFEQFLSAKKEQPATGCFGYYMKQVRL